MAGGVAAVSTAMLAVAVGGLVQGAEAADAQHQFCIVGAGPGGLQLGQYMMKGGRDYMLYERNPRAGSFFETYPIHRGLISLNKRNTGRDNAMFNMRHDWNSLLDTDVTPITERTTDRWPHADILTEYARDFAVEQHEKGHIAYNTAAKHVARDSSGGFLMTLSHRDDSGAETHTSTVLCDVLVSTMGLSVPNSPDGMVGLEHCEFYADLPETKEAFEKKKVVIFGLGNAAFETANGMAPYVDYVHVFPGRSKATHPLVSWETRYPGAVRAINADLLDAYLLKSIDGGMQQGRLSMSADSLAVFKTSQGQKALFPYRRDERNKAAAARWPTEKTITAGYFCTDNEWAMDFVKSLGSDIFNTAMQSNVTLAEKVHQPSDTGSMTIEEKFAFSCSAAQLVVPVSAVNDENIDGLVRFAKEGGDPYPLTYDHVIIALGWHQDLSMYADDIKPIMMPNQKYAVMDHEYQSINVPGLYFAGALAHGKDFKRSAGGFIHGFRYTAKALFRIFEVKYQSKPWPSKEFLFQGQKTDLETLDMLVKDTMYRIDNADAPYQMVGALGDGILFDCPKNELGRVTSLKATYLEDVPVAYFNTLHKNQSRILWTYGYNGQRRSLQQSIEGGTLFEVHMWNFQGHCDPFNEMSMDKDMAKEVVVFTEQLHTEWDQQFNRAVFRKLLQGKLQAMFTGKPRDEASRRPTGDVFERDDWVLSDIYVHFNNDLQQEVRVMPKKGGLDPFHKRDQEMTLAPGRGKQLVAIDGQEWTIEVSGGSHPCGGRAAKTFDVSMGKVQDALISKLLEAQEMSGECPKKPKSARGGRLQRARERAEEKKLKGNR